MWLWGIWNFCMHLADACDLIKFIRQQRDRTVFMVLSLLFPATSQLDSHSDADLFYRNNLHYFGFCL